MTFIIMAPAGISSGGPELAHQMCAQIKANGYDAYMYYVFENPPWPADTECVDKYKKYETEHIKDHEFSDTEDNIIIIPEELTDYAKLFKKAKIVLWWMSVDNFSGDVSLLDKTVVLHLAQSEYARNFLLKNDIANSKIITVSDYISELYGQFLYPGEYRNNMVVFNPKKGLDTIKPLIEMTPDISWCPLYNLTEEEMVLHMEMAKAYVDFGNHPGKDRIPREAALCGCCVVTNKKGSAAFHEDVPIPGKYKFSLDETEDEGYTAVAKLLYEICDNYNDFTNDFNEYRNIIREEKSKFADDVKNFIAKIAEV